MNKTQESREFKRKGIRCVLDCLSVPQETELSFEELTKRFFSKKAPDYYDVAKKMNFNDSSDVKTDAALNQMMKSKFYTLVFSMYPSVYEHKSKVNISEKGIAFESKKVYKQESKVHLMIILENEILPLILSSFIVRVVPDKNRQLYRYAVNFLDMDPKDSIRIKRLFD